jgi:hypothetical protein
MAEYIYENELDDVQRIAVDLIRGDPFHVPGDIQIPAAVIHGPPGTGKTTVIDDGSILYCSDRIRLRRKVQVVIVTPTNTAADRVVEVFMEKFGFGRDPISLSILRRLHARTHTPKSNISDFCLSLPLTEASPTIATLSQIS